MASNQRAHVRYTPNCEAFISLGRGLTRIGSIRDISLAGASFEHFPYNLLEPSDDHVIDIFVCRTDMHITDIPCRIVYELPTSENIVDFAQDSTMIQKRCGIEFKNVSSHHQEQLERFLRQLVHKPLSAQA
jgi:c-di-GMP-binding flagellar brake protein YcgR